MKKLFHLLIFVALAFPAEFHQIEIVNIGPIKDADYKLRCDKLVLHLRLTEKVFWKHNVGNIDIPKYYSSSMMTVIPSLRREGTSLSALESMACECPTITTNIGGLSDLPSIQSNPTPIELSAKMKYVADNRELIKTNQYEAVTKIYNFDNWSEAWCKATGLN